jgi:hypothetical protein
MDDDLIQQHMAKAGPQGRMRYARFIELLDAIGPYTVHPAKSTITFKGTRRGFCGAHPRGDTLVGYFDLTRPLEADRRLRSVSPYTQRLFVHQFRIHALDDMDDGFVAWLSEAYAMGQGSHLKPPRGTPA